MLWPSYAKTWSSVPNRTGKKHPHAPGVADEVHDYSAGTGVKTADLEQRERPNSQQHRRSPHVARGRRCDRN
ncbi:hypothetical protein FA95DRAFT_1540867, partial [Auriscalpium vulgare]